jgi:peptidoglycan/xylan/chitin deacetylase (PgdA/CDA1 family)
MKAIRTAAKSVARSLGVRRAHVAWARMGFERNLLAIAGRKARRHHGRILCYHSVGQPQMGVNDVSPKQFRAHIDLALGNGFRFVPASHIAETGGRDDELAITFDDGLQSVLTTAAPILKRYEIPWTVFVVTSWADGKHPWCENICMSWRELEACAALGGDTGDHSATHPDFGKLPEDQISEQFENSRRTFRERLGYAPDSLAIPFGQSGNWPATAHRAAVAAGFRTIYAQAEETRPASTIARTFVTRFDDNRLFKALLLGAFDRWEEWL